MCTGAEIAAIAVPLVTGAAQTHFQNQAADDVKSARRAAQQQFNDDVDSRRKVAANEFQDSIQQAGQQKTDQRIQEAVQARADLNQPTFDTRTLLPGQGDTSSAVKTAIVQSQDQGDASIADAGQRAAVLAAFGDADLRRNIQLLQNSNRISTQGNFAQGAVPILQAGLEDAESAGDSNLAIADAIGGIGTIAGAGLNSGAFSAGGFTVPGTGTPSSISAGGVPIPGTKPARVNFFNPNSVSGL